MACLTLTLLKVGRYGLVATRLPNSKRLLEPLGFPIAKEKLQRAVEAYQWATTVDSGGPFFRSNKERLDQVKRIIKLRAQNAPAEKIDKELEAIDAVTSQLLPPILVDH